MRGLLPGFWVRKEAPLTLSDSEPEPDISVVPGKRSDYWAGHPTTAILVVEVAVSSTEIDREKGALYAEAGVSEYWIVLVQEGAVEVHTRAENSGWTSHRRFEAGEDLRSSIFPEVIIPHAALLPPTA
jgi:Uma2 family endonuclease